MNSHIRALRQHNDHILIMHPARLRPDGVESQNQINKRINYFNYQTKGCSKMLRCKAREVMRNEAYSFVRRNDE